MSEARKRGLLLTQQIIYAELRPYEWVDLQPKSTNIDQWGNAVFWQANVPYNHDMTFNVAGPMTNTQPIDVATWAPPCTVHPSGMEYWHQCLDLFLRLQ